MFASHFDLVRSCSIYLLNCKMNGYLARFLQDKGLSCKMYRLARFCQNFARSCKITIRCRLRQVFVPGERSLSAKSKSCQIKLIVFLRNIQKNQFLRISFFRYTKLSYDQFFPLFFSFLS